MLVGLPSRGLRCNGYTLARHVLLERAGWPSDGPAWPGAPVVHAGRRAAPARRSSTPRRCARLAVGTRLGCHAAAHITGGGFAGNLPRDAARRADRAVLDRGTLGGARRIFGEIRRLGNVADDEMARVFNLGLGMVMAVAADRVDRCLGRALPRWAGGGRRVVVGSTGRGR